MATISFTIDNPVREGDYFIVDATVSGISSSSAYVQGIFTHTSSPNYFGFTWGQKEDWVNYQSSTTKEYISQNFPILLRDNPQKIWVRPDFGNSAFKGSGDYFLKLRRYTGASDSSAGESNTLTVYLLAPTPDPTDTPTPTITDISTPTPTPEPTLTLNPTKTPTPTPVKTPTPTVAKTPTPIPTVLKTPTTTVIPGSTRNPSLSTSSSILGTSTGSGDIVAPDVGAGFIPPATITPFPTNNLAPATSPSVLKYTFIFGLILSAGSGVWLYFRHKKD